MMNERNKKTTNYSISSWKSKDKKFEFVASFQFLYWICKLFKSYTAGYTQPGWVYNHLVYCPPPLPKVELEFSRTWKINLNIRDLMVVSHKLNSHNDILGYAYLNINRFYHGKLNLLYCYWHHYILHKMIAFTFSGHFFRLGDGFLFS